MSWKCPGCGSENEDSLIRCVCGDECSTGDTEESVAIPEVPGNTLSSDIKIPQVPEEANTGSQQVVHTQREPDRKRSRLIRIIFIIWLIMIVGMAIRTPMQVKVGTLPGGLGGKLVSMGWNGFYRRMYQMDKAFIYL